MPSFLFRPRCAHKLLAKKRRRAAYGVPSAQEESPMGLRMRPRNDKFFALLTKSGSNVVESAILMEFVAPHERWAELAKQ
jgi:hypothetical protein